MSRGSRPNEGFATRQVRAGVEPDPVTGAILTPIHQTTTYVQPSVDGYREKGYSYSRSHNPTVHALETKLAALEGGVDACAFGTGMAAIHTVLLAYLGAGEHAVVSDVIFGGTLRLCRQILARFGVDFTFVDTSDPAAVLAGVRAETRLILSETPANPTLRLTDIAAVSEVARARGILHVVDNTLLTPCCQRPFELGADLVVHSTTKYLDGHNATVGGAVVCATKEQVEAVRFVQNATGSIMSPFVAWLTLQGCKTLSVRMDAQSAAALEVASYLESHPTVERVLYPGLPSFPQHALAGRQASGYGAMVCCEVRGGAAAGKRVMDAVELWSLAENLGTVESLVTHPATMTHANIAPDERARLGITDGLIRLSVGLETPADLIADLDQALARA
ncbi:MAG: PLP-dependent aspartate aminotransferase family protein [Immundisolibacterales bacterium]|nr:PLP-dependent aspartate aminotransferase family protein [Immundisolibacterales bacterium]